MKTLKIMRQPLALPVPRILAALLVTLIGACSEPGDVVGPQTDVVMLSVIGTNDVHGELLPKGDRGGLTTLSGYVAALREARAADGGAVVLIDAGDMWQGTLESNLTEGASVVEAFNALGYAAAAIGNHEFDFGPVGKLAIPASASDDPRGALKQRATEANFPLLTANLIDAASNAPVTWPNVQPSTILEVAGIKIGIVGVITERALVTTIASNMLGLRIGSLTEAITREAKKLRANGAALVIVTAHAGSSCNEFRDPTDLSRCDASGEIFRVANELPTGLVDHIIAGHKHHGIAHVVNGIAITSSYSSLRAFSRVDFKIDRRSGEITNRLIYPPQSLHPSNGQQSYEGKRVVVMPAIVAIADRAAAYAREIKSEKLGVVLETPFTLEGNPESALANLMTVALLESLDVDVVFHNVSGGIRAPLPQGDLTYGSVFEMFPFDNRVVVLEIVGADLRKIVARQAHNHGHRAGFAGMRVIVDCADDQMSVTMTLASGKEVQDDDRLHVAANDFLSTGGDDILTPAMPQGGFEYDVDLRLTRDVIANWFRQLDGSLHADQFQNVMRGRWYLPDALPATCAL